MTLTIETHRSGVFTFQIGAELTRLQPMIDKVNYGHRLFSSLPLLPDIAATLEKETLLSSIHGTDTIEGGTLSENEILQVIEAPPEITQDEHKRRISSLTLAYRFAEAAAMQSQTKGEQAFVISETFILKLHQFICEGLDADRYRPGQYRDNPKGKITRVGNTEHGGIYKPPQAHIDIKLLMAGWVEWLNSREVSNLPSMIRASLAHYYFERIHPFQDGNGRAGRLLEKTILIAAGDKYASRGIDRYYLENIDAYFSAFNHARRLEKINPETCNQGFIEFVLKGFEITIERLHHRTNQLMRDFLLLAWLGDLLREKRINQREHVILGYLGANRERVLRQKLKKHSWYQELYRRYSPATESRDWTHLVNQGIVSKTDDGYVQLNAFRQ